MGRKKRSKQELQDSIPYFIVEGCTEENYLTVLKSIFRKKVKTENTNGGNARGVMLKALQTIKKNPEYTTFIVWFDNDKFNDSDNDVLYRLLTKAKVVQSYPCIESWLLAHFEELQNNQLSKQCKEFEEKLKDHIKNYQKNNCTQLKDNIDEKNINLSKSNYPKYTGNIEAILNEFENNT